MKNAPIAALLLLTACETTSPPAAVDADGGATCGAEAYQDLIGRGAAAAIALPEPKRSYGPDDMITMDFRPERLNIKLDDTDTIFAITCG